MSTIDSGPAPSSAAASAADRTAGRADAAIRIGAIVFAVGTVATLATLVPFLIGADALPRAVYLLSALMPLGLGVALSGLVATARSQRRSVPE
ncbi:hypothetical protein [Yinghuangia soli]|uniref:Integral membrane protein n=1 Tax=Yinghuangia soli TaxID=2908204 RepID=A0AA41U1A5_9ACTN|nr:hypothetical protein [Yinghuangia soli]MCF2529426.1 hypothetical protein [Yinghuangia soli]